MPKPKISREEQDEMEAIKTYSEAAFGSKRLLNRLRRYHSKHDSPAADQLGEHEILRHMLDARLHT